MKNKIAIKVENELEFNALMRHYEEKKCWNWCDGKKPTSQPYYDQFCVEFHDCFHSDSPSTPPERLCENLGYTVIPFAHLAAIEGIKIEKEPTIIELPNEFTATVYADHVEVYSTRGTGCKLFKKEVEEIYTALKSFEED